MRHLLTSLGPPALTTTGGALLNTSFKMALPIIALGTFWALRQRTRSRKMVAGLQTTMAQMVAYSCKRDDDEKASPARDLADDLKNAVKEKRPIKMNIYVN